MKKVILFGLAVLLVLTVTVSCKKKKDGGSNDRCGETEIKVLTIPNTGTVDPPQPGTSFPLIVNIDAMPPSGASVIVTAKVESGGAPYFTDTLKNATAANNFTITNTPAGSSCLVDITVTSKTCNTNQWKGSYRYSAK